MSAIVRSLAAVALAAACPACSGGTAQSGSSGTSTTTTTGTGAGATSTSTTTGLPGTCMSTDECQEDDPAGHCVASYDPATGTMGPAMCVPDCVMPADLQAWCIDHASCCPGLLCSAVDGFCYAPGETTGTDTGGTATGTGTGTGG